MTSTGGADSATSRRGRPRNEEARRRIAHAGQKLFEKHGYVATTMNGVAAEAQVSAQTIYSACRSKVGVLKAAHDVAIGGDDVRPLLERDWAQLSRSASIEEAWEAVVEHVARSTAQVAPIYVVIQFASADPDVALLRKELHEQRYEYSRILTERLLSLPGARSDADPRRLTDLLYSCASVASYVPLVLECRWSLDEWKNWLFGLGSRELFEEPSSTAHR